MYIQKVEIKNIRSLTNFTWEVSAETSAAGWHVLIGDNGSGKSTVLRAMALALIGESQALRLNPDWQQWLRYGADAGTISLTLNDPPGISVDLTFLRNGKLVEVKEQLYTSPQNSTRLLAGGSDYQWRNNGQMFSAAFGPFRRFSGGDEKTQFSSPSSLKVAAHATIFDESIALSSYRKWLEELDYRSLKAGDDWQKATMLLDTVKDFINQPDFLPYNTRFEGLEPGAKSVQIIFVDGDNKRIDVEELGDGFRSILSMTFELIRLMTLHYDLDKVFDKQQPGRIITPGIVLIDEIDAHLHPEWQRRIGTWLVQHFPNIQFIVTTHSPLVCQAASRGSIWRLAAPGSEEKSEPVARDSEDWKRLVYGNILEAYSTNLFGENIDRSPEAQEKFERVAELSAKEMDTVLTVDEERELQKLVDELPSTPDTQLALGSHD